MSTVIYTDQPVTLDPGSDWDLYQIDIVFTGSNGLYLEKTLTTGQNGPFTFTPTSEEFAPYMIKTFSGVLTVLYETVAGRRRTFDEDYTLVLNESIKPSVELVTYDFVNAFNNRPIIGISSAYMRITIKDLYGVNQEIRVLDENGYQIDYQIVEYASDGSTTINTSSFVKDINKSKQAFTIVVTDSRGRSCRQSENIGTCFEYTPPAITASVVWNSSNTPALSYIVEVQTSVANATNSVQNVQLLYTDSIGKTYNETYTNANMSGVPLSGTFDDAGIYNFSLKVTDKISYSTRVLKLEGNKPLIDLGADGNTVAIFCQAPNSADTKSVMIGEIGKITTKLTIDGLSMHYSNMKFLELGPCDDQDCIKYTLGRRQSDSLNGPFSLVIGDQNISSGRSSIAGGEMCEASGDQSIAIGYNCIASGKASVALGNQVIAAHEGQIVLGSYNVEDEDIKYRLIVGNGDNGIRENVIGVVRDGDVEINGKSINGLHSGLVYHCYSNIDYSTGTNNNTYVNLGCFKSKQAGSLSSLATIDSDYYVKFLKDGVYSVQLRYRYNCATQYKRFELAPFINDGRLAYLAISKSSTINNATLVDMVNYTFNIAANDVLRIKVKPIDAVSVTVCPLDICITALDYTGKYK